MGDLRERLRDVGYGEWKSTEQQLAEGRWAARVALDILDSNNMLGLIEEAAIKARNEAREVALCALGWSELPTKWELDEYPWNVPFVRDWLKAEGVTDTVADNED